MGFARVGKIVKQLAAIVSAQVVEMVKQSQRDGEAVTVMKQ